MVNEQEIRPKFLPQLKDVKELTLSDDAVDAVAFVLAGVDPIERQNLSHGHMDLRSLAGDPAANRIGSSSALRDDHKYILAPQFDFMAIEFEDVWQKAKDVRAGQEATELLKLVKQLHRLEIDDDGNELRSSKNAELIRQVREHSHRLLHRLYRNAVRHIGESLKSPSKPQSQPWYLSVFVNLGLRKRVPPERVYVDDDIRDEAIRYIKDAIKIGRILRVGRQRA